MHLRIHNHGQPYHSRRHQLSDFRRRIRSSLSQEQVPEHCSHSLTLGQQSQEHEHRSYRLSKGLRFFPKDL